jgi:hypothetical protein
MSDHVWVVTQWLWGGGGDDDRRVVAVCETSERAYALAAQQPRDRHHSEPEVEAFPLDEAVPER